MTSQLRFPTLTASLLAITLASAASAQTETMPIAGAATSTELTGTVTIVNQEKRMLTIETSDGRFEVLHVPPAVKRLDEIKIGNRLTITETEALLVDLKKGSGAGTIGMSQNITAERDPGTKPSGAIVDTATISGRVESVDKAGSTVTIQGPNRAVTLKVEDPALLDSLAVGDGVEASYMRVISGKVEFQ
ncbi:copper-binding protein [Thiorhodococcus mannitoliphagus]|uniref:Copper-binding protein n=1 Tax=Thiorhodococcus mannitoliphagus TaxID=329406 RepID=A0A6P1DT59_9GAMM|nr:copper-binding protein [Thiorhodococcus mannitoliphagus]NEX18895.1 copper-binding protein [Thiorhodococcus mannitoliphagus]